VAVILIVDDEEFLSDLAQLMIEDMGHSTCTARTFDEAMAVLRRSDPIDALFTDIRFDRSALAGYNLARQAIKLRPQLRVLYASGSAPIETTKALFVRGACFVQKPYSQEQLELAIQALLAAPDPQTRSTTSP